MTVALAPSNTKFDPSLTEATICTDVAMVHIYKIGGGTLGHSYIGFWGYRIVQNGKTVASGVDYYTGMPATHRSAALGAVRLHADTHQTH